MPICILNEREKNRYLRFWSLLEKKISSSLDWKKKWFQFGLEKNGSWFLREKNGLKIVIFFSPNFQTQNDSYQTKNHFFCQCQFLTRKKNRYSIFATKIKKNSRFFSALNHANLHEKFSKKTITWGEKVAVADIRKCERKKKYTSWVFNGFMIFCLEKKIDILWEYSFFSSSDGKSFYFFLLMVRKILFFFHP